jgi:hypothetical protein
MPSSTGTYLEATAAPKHGHKAQIWQEGNAQGIAQKSNPHDKKAPQQPHSRKGMVDTRVSKEMDGLYNIEFALSVVVLVGSRMHTSESLSPKRDETRNYMCVRRKCIEVYHRTNQRDGRGTDTEYNMLLYIPGIRSAESALLCDGGSRASKSWVEP